MTCPQKLKEAYFYKSYFPLFGSKNLCDKMHKGSTLLTRSSGFKYCLRLYLSFFKKWFLPGGFVTLSEVQRIPNFSKWKFMGKTIIVFLLYILDSCCFSCKYFLFLLNKNEESPTFQAFFWPLKLIKTLFTYVNYKIKSKPSLDGTMSPNIFFSFPNPDTALCYILTNGEMKFQFD